MNKRINKYLLCLMAFLVYSIICKYLQAINRQSNGGVYLQYMLLVETLLCIPLYYCCKKKYSRFVSPAGNNFISFIVIYLSFEILNTMLFSPTWYYIRIEAVYWILFIGAFYMGANREFWKYLTPTILFSLLLSSVLSLSEISTGTLSYIRAETNGINMDSYLYDIQIGFTACSFALIYYVLKDCKYKRMIAIGAFVLYVCLQFFFQKRLPLARVFVTICVLLYIVKKYRNNIKISKLYICGILALMVGAITYVPQELISATIDRFFEGGTASATVSSDSRYIIMNKALETNFSSPISFLFGHGLGGCVLGDFEGKMINIGGVAHDGLSEFEVGWACYFFKYGIVFILMFYSFILRKLWQLKSYLSDPLALACWGQVLITTLFSILGESFPNVSVPFSTFLLASSLGYLSLNTRNI